MMPDPLRDPVEDDVATSGLGGVGDVEPPGLPGLRSRTADDYTLALADAWAVYDNSGRKPRLLEQSP